MMFTKEEETQIILEFISMMKATLDSQYVKKSDRAYLHVRQLEASIVKLAASRHKHSANERRYRKHKWQYLDPIKAICKINVFLTEPILLSKAFPTLQKRLDHDPLVFPTIFTSGLIYRWVFANNLPESEGLKREITILLYNHKYLKRHFDRHLPGENGPRRTFVLAKATKQEISQRYRYSRNGRRVALGLPSKQYDLPLRTKK